MSWIKAVGHEVWSLFVDDGSFAGAVVVWLVVVGLVVRLWPGGPGRAAGLVVFAGLAAVLIESAVRRAGR